jgi:hypothetical protein
MQKTHHELVYEDMQLGTKILDCVKLDGSSRPRMRPLLSYRSVLLYRS